MNDFTWFTGVIEDIVDPKQMNRVRVRCFGFHTDDKALINTVDLPWATVMLPTDSSGTSGIGTTVHGLLPGSWVVGFFRDGTGAQDPIVMGSISSMSIAGANTKKGFNDPTGQFPRSEYIGQSDVNKLARGENTIVYTPDQTTEEPESPYKAEYPYNKVTHTVSGHTIELDDTPEGERIRIAHRSGTLVEMHPNGDIVQRNKNKWQITTGNNKAHITGNLFIQVDGNANINVKGDMDTYVKGNSTINCENNITAKAQRDMLLGAEGDVEIIGWNVRVSSSAEGRIDFNYEPETITIDLTNFVYGEPTFASPGGSATFALLPGGTYAGGGTSYAVQAGEYIVSDEPTGCTREDLGALSSKYESNGDPGAIGWDSTGGASYGEYQIATKTGTMSNFLAFLAKRYPETHAKLNSSGSPYANSRTEAQSSSFGKKWKELAASDQDFKKYQHQFIQATHFDPMVRRIKAATGIDICDGTHSVGIQDAVWSTAVQHGPGSSIPIKGFQSLGSGLASATDNDLVNALYDERDRVDVYFKSSTEAVQDSVAKRFVRERRDALV